MDTPMAIQLSLEAVLFLICIKVMIVTAKDCYEMIYGKKNP